MDEISKNDFAGLMSEGFHKQLWELIFDIIDQRGFKICKK